MVNCGNHSATLFRRFWDKVELGDGCWNWTGAKDRRGYGRLGLGGRDLPKGVLAPRVSWMFKHGDAGELCVLHHCDNPSCVRPSHLFLGTRNDNQQDMKLKGRHFRANQTHCKRGHELTPENIYIQKRPTTTQRGCKQCAHERSVREWAEHKMKVDADGKASW